MRILFTVTFLTQVVLVVEVFLAEALQALLAVGLTHQQVVRIEALETAARLLIINGSAIAAVPSDTVDHVEE